MAPPSPKLISFTPTISPFMLTSGPPELPGWISASWKAMNFRQMSLGPSMLSDSTSIQPALPSARCTNCSSSTPSGGFHEPNDVRSPATLSS